MNIIKRGKTGCLNKVIFVRSRIKGAGIVALKAKYHFSSSSFFMNKGKQYKIAQVLISLHPCGKPKCTSRLLDNRTLGVNQQLEMDQSFCMSNCVL